MPESLCFTCEETKAWDGEVTNGARQSCSRLNALVMWYLNIPMSDEETDLERESELSKSKQQN